jgi:hypothetical protein
MTLLKILALPHQVKSMKKMCQLEKSFIEYNNIKIKTKIGIITDPNNSGKSTTVALFLKKHNKIKNKPYDYCNNKFFSVILKKENNTNKNLIIVSHKCLIKWINLNTILKLQSAILTNSIEIKKFNLIENNCKNIIILDSKLKELDSKLDSPKWNRIIADKTENLKIFSDFLWKSNFIWFISNKPDIIYFSKKIYHELLENIPNYCFDLVTIKNNINDILDSFKIFPYQTKKISVKKDNFFQKDELKNLSYNISKKEITQLIEKLNLTSIHVDFDKNSCCPVSLEQLKYPVQVQCCKNLFSLVSILKSYSSKNQCPLCRQHIDLDDIKITFGNNKFEKQDFEKIEVDNALLIFPDKNNKSIYNNYYKKIIKNFNKLNSKEVDLVDIFGNNYEVSLITKKKISKLQKLYIFYLGETKDIFNNIIKKLSLYYRNSKIIFYQLIEKTQ